MDGEEFSFLETYHGVAYANPEEWVVTGPDGVTPVDLTGKSFTAHARSGTPDAPGPVVLSVSTANGRVTVVPLQGKIGLSLSAADLGGVSLPPGDYYQELVDVTGGTPQDVIDRTYWSHRPTGAGA